jgi:hypothetical protein
VRKGYQLAQHTQGHVRLPIDGHLEEGLYAIIEEVSLSSWAEQGHINVARNPSQTEGKSFVQDITKWFFQIAPFLTGFAAVRLKGHLL